MLKRIFLIVVALITIAGCGKSAANDNTDSSNIVIDEQTTKIHFVELSNQNENLLSIEYQITNQTKENIGPFYVNYVIHGQTLLDLLGFNEYSSYKELGGEGIKLESGDTYQGGDNLQVSKEKNDFINFQDENSNAIEIQIVDIETETVLTSLKIHKFSFVNDGSLSQLLEKTSKDGSFLFENLPWLISKQEVIDQQVQGAIQSEETNRIIVEGALDLDAEVEQTVIYNFQDDQLVSGEYWFVTSDEQYFVEMGKELKALLTNGLSEPRTNNLAVLDQAARSSEQGEHMIWEGLDRSGLRINLLMTDQGDYLLQIHATSPQPEREGLQ